VVMSLKHNALQNHEVKVSVKYLEIEALFSNILGRNLKIKITCMRK